MAVYTEVTPADAQVLLDALQLGTLTELLPCKGGIENTNYFVTAHQDETPRELVLTLFERLSAEQLPFYLHLMKHLAQQGIPVPEPSADAQRSLLFNLCGKPAAVVNKLAGASVLQPQPQHCAVVGAMLARMHLAGRNFDLEQPNLRGLAWWNATVPEVLPFVTPTQRDLLLAELAYQNHVAAGSNYAALPRGPVHADLFRDNVLFADANPDAPVLGGFFDFYFAGIDTWLFDLAVCLNDWCVVLPEGGHDAARARAFYQAYVAVRPLQAAERALLPTLLRAGALRFWLSRLWDLHLPREASVLSAHDPSQFERILRERVEHPVDVAQLELPA